ncbi:hypothetical protein T492DRAFT_993597 [Pavlovales sp. CCMP2436]|nr:hypothetical protein T492DRAFT_993597 [Pavlovales sp. CCMP2436]|mmetsp:Transcript_21976/g.55738  ORF Transcript_21976/g.55738 Transcript_21976/m.55738 type:complete len:287 (-) Transcript_21976:29-889(-)
MRLHWSDAEGTRHPRWQPRLEHNTITGCRCIGISVTEGRAGGERAAPAREFCQEGRRARQSADKQVVRDAGDVRDSDGEANGGEPDREAGPLEGPRPGGVACQQRAPLGCALHASVLGGTLQPALLRAGRRGVVERQCHRRWLFWPRRRAGVRARPRRRVHVEREQGARGEQGEEDGAAGLLHSSGARPALLLGAGQCGRRQNGRTAAERLDGGGGGVRALLRAARQARSCNQLLERRDSFVRAVRVRGRVGGGQHPRGAIAAAHELVRVLHRHARGGPRLERGRP